MADTSVTNKYLTVSIMGKEGAIGIHKNIVKSLGCPNYLCLRISPSRTSFLLRPCEADEKLSFQMPSEFLGDHHVNYRIRSLRFVQNLLSNNKLDRNGSYYLIGKMIEDKKTVVFPLISALPINRDTEGECIE